MALSVARIPLKRLKADPPKKTSHGMFWVVWSYEDVVIDSAWLTHEELDWQIAWCNAAGWDWVARWEPRADLHGDNTGLIPQIQEIG